VNALGDFVSTILAATDNGSPFAVGTVATVTANGANPPLVTVNWQGSEVPAICPRECTPVVGRVVVMARFGAQLNILNSY
jgi:hypothetical protein